MNPGRASYLSNPSEPPLTLVRAPLLQRKCRCGNHSTAGGECESCRKKHAEASLGGATPPYRAAATSGQTLDAVTRATVELRFGRDFSQVRVHADDAAGEAARAVNARAFAVGQHIHFGAGEYRPQSQQGMLLLAHELAHTVQQSGLEAGVRQLSSDALATEDPGLEREADDAAAQVVNGQPAHVVGSASSPAPQRQPKGQTPPQAPKVVAPVPPNNTQKKMIDNARRAAAIRTQTATFKASGVAGLGAHQEATRLAQIKFDWANPNMDQVSEVLAGIGGGLISVDVKVAGPGDPECGPRSGYVRGHSAPIVLCPGFFADPADNEGRIRTMVHEMAHVKGVGNAAVGESYFPIFDCTSTGAFASADAWSNYVHCLSGQTPDKPPEIVGPVKGGKSGKPPAPRKP